MHFASPYHLFFMQKGWLILWLLLSVAACPAQSVGLPSWDNRAQTAWWTQQAEPPTWPQAVKDLTAQLEAAYRQNGANVFSNADFQGWLAHLQWIQLGLDNPQLIAEPEALKAFIAVGKDDAISHLFVEKLDPRDVRAEALKNILLLAQANPADLHDYAALGVAFSLVFDQPFPTNWPHHQVKQEAVPIGDLDIVPRFQFYLQANKDRKTALDLTQVSFENLKFLVDSEVKLSELEYALADKLPYSHFDDAFFVINYDTSRIGGGNFAFEWSQPTYTLDDIKNIGGICVDQAYYATILGKGRGIPTLYFHGQGSSGGHAWFGYMTRSGRWNLDCGRYASQNYPKGYALDPQTWQPIDDTRLTNFFKNGEKNANYLPAQTALAWAKLHGYEPVTLKILEQARKIMPELSETWEMEAVWLQKTHASADDQKAFYRDWINQFTTFADMKIEGQRRLLAVMKETKDPGAQDLERSLVIQNRGRGFDEGIQASAAPIFDKIKEGDWDAARLQYERAIRDFGEQGGGTLFYAIIVPYVEACLKADQVKQADRAIHFTEERMPLDPEGVIGSEFAKLKGEVSDLVKKLPK